MKRVLVITYHFPPRPTVGSLRLGGLAKYLPRFGWEPVIVTPRFPGRDGWAVPIVETDYHDVLGELKQRLGLQADKGLQAQLGLQGPNGTVRSWFLSRLTVVAKAVWCYPDDQRGWFHSAVDAALDVARRFGCAALLSSSGPVTTHLVAKAVKMATGLPWVADLRDLWTDNHYYDYPRLRWLIERRLEIRVLGAADAMVTVSDPWARLLRWRYGSIPVWTILNGYDPEEAAPGFELSKDFTITYTGTIYNGKRDPTTLFQALRSLANRGVVERGRVRVGFYGHDFHKVAAMATTQGVEDMVTAHPPVPRKDIVRIQRQSQVLLLLLWDHPAEFAVYPAKLFEYLAARRPILATGGPRGVAAELLENVRAGVYASDKESIERTLQSWWDQYVTSGRVTYGATPADLEYYSQLRMARQFADVLERIASTAVRGV